VLVLSIDARNQRASDLIVVPCSTTLREAPTHVRLARGEGGVPKACMLKCEQITTLPIGELGTVPLGSALAAPRLRDIERAVARAIGVAV
jgi:mRNA-degrading endonuclease toxin of MazEF toxin-antitoxin module